MMEIIAKGNRLVQSINGVHFATLIDQDAEMSRAKGAPDQVAAKSAMKSASEIPYFVHAP